MKTFDTSRVPPDAAARHGARVIPRERGIPLSCIALRVPWRARPGRLQPLLHQRLRRTRVARQARVHDDQPTRSRVGIGVPSSRSGAFRITTGAPVSSRTTTENRAANWSAEECLHRRDVLSRRPLIDRWLPRWSRRSRLSRQLRRDALLARQLALQRALPSTRGAGRWCPLAVQGTRHSHPGELTDLDRPRRLRRQLAIGSLRPAR